MNTHKYFVSHGRGDSIQVSRSYLDFLIDNYKVDFQFTTADGRTVYHYYRMDRNVDPLFA
jgi:hypothetical protein